MAGTSTTGRAPVEAKAQAAGVAGGAAGVVLWVLQTYAFKGAAVPAGLVSLVDVAVPGILALAGAYLAPHTPRPAAPAAPPAARGGYPAGGTPVSEMPPPPPSATQAPPAGTGM
jgi:hypothetical protein